VTAVVARRARRALPPRPRRAAAADTEIEVQYAVGRAGIPHPASLRAWAQAALAQARTGRRRAQSVTLRIVAMAEGRKLNRQWRGKDKPTNVLSFPSGTPMAPGDEPESLGDIVICAPVIRREAADQGKTSRAHWAHMVVHGILHLLGYDHESNQDAEVMERLERTLLARAGFPDPYQLKDAVRR
jgi:probable rRNA maturation factor